MFLLSKEDATKKAKTDVSSLGFHEDVYKQLLLVSEPFLSAG